MENAGSNHCGEGDWVHMKECLSEQAGPFAQGCQRVIDSTLSATSSRECCGCGQSAENGLRPLRTLLPGWKYPVARQTTVRFVDDLDGLEAAGTVEFGLEGRSYEIDLSDENAKKLREALAPFVDAARKPGGRSSGRGRGRAQSQPVAAEKPRGSSREETASIRESARANGHKVNDRGRISKSVIEAYKEAQSGAQSGGRQSAARVTDPFNAE
jgi:Lsr2